MLYNGEKLRIPSTNEWPQNMGEMLLMPGNNKSENNNSSSSSRSSSENNKKNASTTTSNSNSSTSTNNNMIHAAAAAAAAPPPGAARVMDKPAQDQQVALKCPRCDSSNTKFCYYNNYSLSQPRHFCKACKRYWTRGGTLRNVPVGGGCRKNKRVKKPTSAAAAAASDPLPSPLMPPTSSVPSISLPNPTSHLDPPMNPLFYSLPTATSSCSSSDLGLAFSGLRTSSVPHGISIPCTGFDSLQQPQLDSLGLGFPSSQSRRDDEFHLSQLQTSASVMSDYPLFGSTAASLLLSSLRQPKKLEDYQALMSYEDLHAASAEATRNLEVIEEVKREGDCNAIHTSRIEWQIPFDHSFDAIVPAASTSLAGDSSFLYWNSAIGAWPDSANCGSSVAPLI